MQLLNLSVDVMEIQLTSKALTLFLMAFGPSSSSACLPLVPRLGGETDALILFYFNLFTILK